MKKRYLKQRLSWCAGRCAENSVFTELYGPFKASPELKMGPVVFKRVAYCLNKGCGWRLAWPDVQIDVVKALDRSRGIVKAYLGRMKKKHPNLMVGELWICWMHTRVELNFEEYLRTMEARRQSTEERVSKLAEKELL